MCSLHGRNFISKGHGFSKKEKSCITLEKPLSVHAFFKISEFFPVPPLSVKAYNILQNVKTTKLVFINQCVH